MRRPGPGGSSHGEDVVQLTLVLLGGVLLPTQEAFWLGNQEKSAVS